jgi:hypothetical protein
MGKRLLWLADVARAAGLRVREVDGWRTRGALVDGWGLPLDPRVVICHHTAESASSYPAGGLRVVTYGRTGLPGPIANYYLSRDAVVYVVASGVSHNAGTGNARTAGHPEWYGNGRTIGIEAADDGSGAPYPPAMYDAYVRLCAAICDHMGWPASRVLGHKEWSTTGKVDPTFSMSQFRTRLAGLLDQEDDMPIRTSLGKTAPQSLAWGRFVEVLWDKEYADPSGAHRDAGSYPGYNPPGAGWVDSQVQLAIEGLAPGDSYQIRYDMHTWRDGRSIDRWSEIVVDAPATGGRQYATAAISKHLGAEHVLRVSVAVFAAEDSHPDREAPSALSGRWALRQDRAA